MTFPPNTYGTKCGRSWGRPLTVTGEINSYWGKQIKTTIPAIIAKLPPLGYSKIGEERLEIKLREEIGAWTERLTSLRGQDILSGSDHASLRYLLETAEANLESIPEVYQKWDEFACVQGVTGAKTVCPWPLTMFDDRVQGWMAQCANPAPGRIYEDRYGRAFSCPPPSISLDRKADRNAIKGRFLAALRHLRCCQYWATRARLMDQARKTKPTHDPTQTFGPGGSGPRPPEPPPAAFGGGFGAAPRPGEPPGPPKPSPQPTPHPGAGSGGEPFVPPEGPLPLPIPAPEDLPDEFIPGEFPPGDPDSEGFEGSAPVPRKHWGWLLGGAVALGVASWLAIKGK